MARRDRGSKYRGVLYTMYNTPDPFAPFVVAAPDQRSTAKIHTSSRSEWARQCADQWPEVVYVQALDGITDAVWRAPAFMLGEATRYDRTREPGYRNVPCPIFQLAAYWFIGAWNPRAMQSWGRGWLHMNTGPHPNPAQWIKDHKLFKAPIPMGCW